MKNIKVISEDEAIVCEEDAFGVAYLRLNFDYIFDKILKRLLLPESELALDLTSDDPQIRERATLTIKIKELMKNK